MKPQDMSAKEYAQYLHENCCLPFDEACRMAGYSPEDEMREQFWTFAYIVLGVALAGAILAVIVP